MKEQQPKTKLEQFYLMKQSALNLSHTYTTLTAVTTILYTLANITFAG